MTTSGADGSVRRSERIFERSGPIPLSRLERLARSEGMSLTVRQSSTQTATSSNGDVSCAPDDTTGPCERMVAYSSISKTAPIILGIVVPIVAALIVLVILHRRNLKKLKKEDAEDRQKSLDFGLGDAVIVAEKVRRGRGGHRTPEMSSMYGSGRRDRGLSMDLSMANPYLLPPELQHSRESLHSLSRSLNGGDDKYRATNFIPDDGSLRSPSSLRHHDDASIYTYSSKARTETESTKGLIPNAAKSITEPLPQVRRPPPAAKENSSSLLAPMPEDASRESYVSTASENGNIAAMRASNNYLGQYIRGGVKKEPEKEHTHENIAELNGDAPHPEPEQPSSRNVNDDHSKRNSVVHDAAGFDFGIPPNTYELASGHDSTLPQFDITPAENTEPEIYEAPGHEIERDQVRQPPPQRVPETDRLAPRQSNTHSQPKTDSNTNSVYEDVSDYYDEDEDGVYDIYAYRDALGYDPRLLAMGMRPLPPDDPSENPEERALRIRSFYKEYFEDTTKPGGEKKRMSYFDGSENYIDDYYGSQNHAPYGYGPRGSSTMSARGPRGRRSATVSNGSYLYGGPGPRAYSSASQRLPGPHMRQPPKKNLPPPKPLHVLRNPATFKDDSMLMNSIDFAPPQTLRNSRPGTPDSQRGGRRPYSPSVKAYNPLVSSFDDLSVLPSPHHLRKSGTFTSLDFAPPRFAATGAGSDAGSIRSNHSQMSAMQLHNIRAGAYRLSRIPKDLAGTKEELADALRPQWSNAR